MNRLQTWVLQRWVRQQAEEGQGLAEYGLILALVSVVCATALVTLQGSISTVFGDVTAKL